MFSFSLSALYFTCRKLQASFFVCVLCEIAMGVYHPSNHYVLLFPICEKITFSYEIMFPQKGEGIWSGFQAI